MSPPQRIRVVSHPPLPPLRAWLPIPSSTAQVSALVETAAQMLATTASLEVELQGFALLPSSPCSILDPQNDVLDIKISTLLNGAPVAGSPNISKSSPAKGTQSKPSSSSTTIPSSRPTLSAPKANTTSSDSDTSEDSSDDSSSEDEGPEVQPTSAASHHHPAPLIRIPAAKRARIEPLAKGATVKNGPRSLESSSSGSSSDDGGSSSDSSSISSDSSSGSGLSSSSDEDSSDSERPRTVGSSNARLQPNGKAQIPANGTQKQPHKNIEKEVKAPVAPGMGLKRTKERNARKRLAKAFALEAAKSTTSTSAPPGQSTSKPAQPSPKPRTTTSLASDYLPPPATTKSSGSKALPLDPYYDLHGPKLDMLHLAKGNQNKKKTIRINGKGKDAVRTVFHDAGAEALDVARENGPRESEQPGVNGGGNRLDQAEGRSSSPSWTPSSPKITPQEFVPSDTPAGKKGKGRPSEGGGAAGKPKHPLHPSERTDLPSNVIVTVIDVEKEGWEPGPGDIVAGTSSTTASAVGLDWGTGPRDSSSRDSSTPQSADAWVGWPSRETIEAQWSSYEKLSENEADATVGARVATKVLELDPITFGPTLSLKFGVLQVSSEAPLSILLHPSCVPTQEEEQVEEEYEESEGWYGGGYDDQMKLKMRFGQPAIADEEQVAAAFGSTFEGDWGEVRLLSQ
ncbi:hypothetical protein T439DRAFT_327943 [Meredithblackwellia eburnea MCA 4105]